MVLFLWTGGLCTCVGAVCVQSPESLTQNPALVPQPGNLSIQLSPRGTPEKLSGSHFESLSGSLCPKPIQKPFSGPQAVSFRHPHLSQMRLISRPDSRPAAHCGPIEPIQGPWSSRQLSRNSARGLESMKTHKDSFGGGRCGRDVSNLLTFPWTAGAPASSVDG
jgi:hypothetical protein